MKVRWIAASVLAAGVASAGSPAAAAPTGAPQLAEAERSALRCARVVRADELEAHVAGGMRVLCAGATVRGNLDLTGIDVKGVFACSGCTFSGDFDAWHVVFDRGIDLSGSTFRGRVNFRGARFEGPALFGSSPAGADCKTGAAARVPGTSFRGTADLAFATFGDVAVFEGARFVKGADFTSARFHGVARFGHTHFCEAAAFPAASFAHDSFFAHASFDREAHFEGAAFGGALDFRQARFGPLASFSEAAFGARADFSQISVPGLASFADARFGGDALFRQVLLGHDDEALVIEPTAAAVPPLLSFDHASLGGPLNLKYAKLFGGVQLGSVSAPSISLERSEFGSGSSLYMDDFTAGALSIRPADLEEHLEAASEQKLAALRVVEATAKADGDLGRANDARYRLQVLESADDPLVQRIGDVALYRGVAGYFVQPLRPVLWLLVVICAAALMRAVREQAHDAERPPPGRVVRAASRFALALAYTVTPGGDKDDTPPLRRLELTAYAALLGCFVLALANTNPTLRQMVEGLL